MERPYFRDIHELTKDPTGKLFAAQSFVKADRLDLLAVFDTPGFVVGSEPRVFGAEELRKKGVHLFVCYQLGFYASPFANEWKKEVLARWPAMKDRIVGVEVREASWAYGFLRFLTQKKVAASWKEGLEEKNGELVVWQATRKKKMELRNLKAALGITNKYIPFVFAVQHQGLVTFKAVGKPLAKDLDLLALSIEPTLKKMNLL